MYLYVLTCVNLQRWDVHQQNRILQLNWPAALSVLVCIIIPSSRTRIYDLFEKLICKV